MHCASIADRARAPTRPSSAAAQSFGKILAENHIRLIYGGGSVGLMGAVANAVLDHGGHVTGIIPEFLTKRERPRRARAGIDRRAETCTTRKRAMFEHADGFVALAGRHRHARRTGRAAHLGAARPPQEADPDRQYLGLLGPVADADRAHAHGEIRAVGVQRRFSGRRRASRIFCRRCARPRTRSPTPSRQWRCRRSGCEPRQDDAADVSLKNVTASMRLPSQSRTKAA